MAGLEASQAVLESTEYTALNTYLFSSEQDLTHGINAFSQQIEEKFRSTSSSADVKALLCTAWHGVVAIAESLQPSSTKRKTLADFLVQVLYRSNLTSNGKTCEINELVVWRDLPVLGRELREVWNSAATETSEQEHKNRWINLNAWTATLVTSLHSSAIDRPDYSVLCIWTLRTALEEDQPSEVAIAAAAYWFIYACPAIWDFSQQRKGFEGKDAAPGALFEHEHWTGFSSSRWNAWGHRLMDLKASLSDEDSRELVQQASNAMIACRTDHDL